LQKDFSSKENRDLRHACRARFSERERDLIKVQWTRKMIESQKHILFFDFLQKYFPSDNAVKQNFEDETVVQSSQKNIEKIEEMLSDLKINQNKASTFVIHQKKTSDFPNTDSIPSDFPSFDNLNHMNCSVLTKSEE
jgi:GTP-sensing pleiotropic transcriptional regulator CodY